MKKMHRKILILLMIFCMTLTMVPSLAFAGAEPAEENAAKDQVTEEVTTEAEEATEVPEEKSEGEEPAPAEEEKTPEAAVEPEQNIPESKAAEQTPKEDLKKEQAKKEAKEEKASDDELLEMNVEAERVVDGEKVSYKASKHKTSNAIIFKATLNGKTYKGTCNECDVAYKSSGTMTVVPLGKNDLRRKVAYKYGSWLESDDRNYDMSGIYKGACLECMMQYARAWEDDKDDGGSAHRNFVVKEWKKSPSNGGAGWSSADCKTITDAVKALNRKTADELGIPGKFRAYFGAIKNTKGDDGRVHGQDALLWGNLVTGSLKVKKIPENPDYVKEHPDQFSLKGAKYQLYTDSACKNKAKDVNWKNALFTTKADGTTNTLTLEIGTYYIKEIKASKGFGIELNTSGKAKISTVKVTEGKTTTFTSKEPDDEPTPIYGVPDFRVYKTDTTGNFDWDVIGEAEFTVKFFEGVEEKDDIDLEEETADSWTFRTSKKSAPEGAPADTFWSGFDWATDTPTESTREFYHPKDFDPKSSDGTTRVLPQGWFAIEETRAPRGHKITDRIYYGWIDKNGTVHYEEPNVDGQLQKQVIIIVDETIDNFAYKVDSDTEENLSGAVLAILDSNGTALETWTTDSEPHVIKGIEDGSYTLREISAPYGYELSDDVPFTVEEGVVKGGEDFYEGDSVLTMSDSPVTVETTAVSASTNSKAGAMKANEIIRDTVVVEGLIEGRTYRLEGKLMNKRTGEIVKDKNGNEVIVSSNPFEATDSRMSIDMDFEFDATKLMDNDSVVVYEKLFRTSAVYDETVPAEGVELAKHEDLEDEGQTVTYGGIASTVAVDAETESDNVLAADNRKVKDTVAYENLVPGQKYVLEGKWYDATAEKMTDITASKEFTPETADGTVDVEFEFDASAYEGHTLVCFERLSLIPKDEDGQDAEPVIIDVHEDPEDESETIHVPKIRTTLKDNETNGHHSMAKEEVTVTDTVKFSNLVPGKEYTFTGKLVYKDNGNDVIEDGEVVTSSVKYTPEESDGEVELTFTFSTSALAGRTIVAYENVYEEKDLVAVHADINDKKQSDQIPKIGTKASDIKTKEHISSLSDNVEFKDTVSYENLIPGEEYVMTGKPVLKSTGSVIKDKSGKDISSSVKFTPEDTSGTVELTFTIPRTALEGETVVAYEDLFYNDVLIATHSDIKDENQSVHIPEIGTVAEDSETADNISYGDKKVTVYDTVTFNNLIPGKTYVLKGTLVDKETAEPIKVNGKKVLAETEFTPDTADGEAIVEFVFDGRSIQGKTVVAFEDLYYENILIAAHADVTDEDQSITIPIMGTKIGQPEGKHVIDSVAFKGLIEGRDYIAKGWLVNKDTGKMVAGSDGETRFTADATKGLIQVRLTQGKNKGAMVAFEEIYLITEEGDEVIVAAHKDINDVDQTLDIENPSPKTGDRTTILWLSIGFTCAAIALIAALLMMRRKERQN